nr:AraC family transcriptional regulator [Paenibacillus shirakamiensis]
MDIARDNIFLPTDFPLTASSTLGVTPSFQRLHWHRELEINWILSGSGIYVINGREYPFTEGDLFLIDSDDLHRAYEGQDLEMGVVMFDPILLAPAQRYDPELLRPFRDNEASSTRYISCTHERSSVMSKYLREILNEYVAKKRSNHSIIMGLLLQFLAEVNRYFSTTELIEMMPSWQIEQMRSVIAAMEEDLSRPWNVRDLAELVHLSPSRFSALFSQVAGSAPLNYLVQLRLAHAVELLEKSDDSILSVAATCGFRNLSNFNRLFRRNYGISPSKMRHRVQQEL